jgi:HlyD family secretion protein
VWARRAGLLAVLGFALVAGWLARGLYLPAPSSTASVPAVTRAERPRGIGCIGQFVPEDGLVRVAAPYYESSPPVVAHLAVREGDVVRKGQLIAYLDGKVPARAALVRATAQLELAKRRLDQTKTGAKPSDREAQRAQVERLESAQRLAEVQFKRSEALFQSRTLAAADLETRREAWDNSRKALEEARFRLNSMSEVREQDVQVAESELAVSEAQLKEIETRLNSLDVFAPVTGRVVKVHAHSGEQPGPEGIVEMADLTRMAVEAEVYASDISAVRLGQQASIEIEGSGTGKLIGDVVRIGTKVRQAAVLPSDPVVYSDAHVVPVQIRIPSCASAPCPIYARVKVTIETAP